MLQQQRERAACGAPVPRGLPAPGGRDRAVLPALRGDRGGEEGAAGNAHGQSPSVPSQPATACTATVSDTQTGNIIQNILKITQETSLFRDLIFPPQHC